jgi:phage gpG-like protein
VPEFHLVGVSEFKDAIDAHIARQMVATREAVAKGAHTIEAKAKDELATSSHPKGTPTPSQPGEPPSLISGSLRRSVRVQGPTGDGKTFIASVGPSMVYGRIQELGGTAGHGNRLPPRPYMKPAVEKSAAELLALFREAWSTW